MTHIWRLTQTNVTFLPPHTLLQLSISLSLLLTLLGHIFLPSFSKPSACQTDPISSCVLTYYFPYSVLALLASHTQSCAFLLFYSLWSSHPKSRVAYFNLTRLSPSHKVLQYCTEVSTLSLYSQFPQTSLSCADHWPPHNIRVHLYCHGPSQPWRT